MLAAGKANGFNALVLANRLFETGLFNDAEPDLTLFDGLLSVPNDPLYNYHGRTTTRVLHCSTMVRPALISKCSRPGLSLGRGGKGTVVLFSSGNNNAGLMYPSTNGGVISVGGVNICGHGKSLQSYFYDKES